MFIGIPAYLNNFTSEYLNTWVFEYRNIGLSAHLHIWVLELRSVAVFDYLNTWVIEYLIIGRHEFQKNWASRESPKNHSVKHILQFCCRKHWEKPTKTQKTNLLHSMAQIMTSPDFLKRLVVLFFFSFPKCFCYMRNSGVDTLFFSATFLNFFASKRLPSSSHPPATQRLIRNSNSSGIRPWADSGISPSIPALRCILECLQLFWAAGLPSRKTLAARAQLGRGPHKYCKRDLDDQTWQELELLSISKQHTSTPSRQVGTSWQQFASEA